MRPCISLALVASGLIACSNGARPSATVSGEDPSGGAGVAPPGDPDGGDPGTPAAPETVTVTVGAPAADCHVYEFRVPSQDEDWLHVPDGTPIVYQSNPPA